MLPIAAYADRLSARPGETIRFHVANATAEVVHPRIERVICADPNPAGPGIQLEAVAAEIRKCREPGPEVVPRGSHFVADGLERLPADAPMALSMHIRPTRLGEQVQTLATWLTADGVAPARLYVSRERLLTLEGSAGGAIHCQWPLQENRWYRVWCALPAPGTGGEAVIGARALGDEPLGHLDQAGRGPFAAPGAGSYERLVLAARPVSDHRERAVAPFDEHFNGKLEAPALFAADADVLADVSLLGLVPGENDACMAAWDFAADPSSCEVVDRGPHGLHGRVVNRPARAMTGSNWDGEEMCFRHAPERYGAIHFHEDDLDDCAWPVCYEWDIPESCRSGVYALWLEAGDQHENVPFYVVPAKGKPRAPLAVLASTYTYTVYGNHARPEWDADPAWQAAWREQAEQWGAYPHNPGDHREYGLSTYNWHTDASGISIASWHRPMLNVRVGYITYPYPEIRGSGLRHFPADSHLIAWLESKGIDYDVITDQELHQEGLSLLAPYRAVLTGSHPEYHTGPMLQALERYRDQGGRLAYLGGNGFYWKIALAEDDPGVVEIRRGEGGIRAWAAEPGEYYNQFDGEYGGMWRRNGRPPQRLCGVGFTAQGNFAGSYYRRLAEAELPRVSWMFEGVDGEVIGDHGLSAHGAAGFELDRADSRLGTPLHALVVARSENHPPQAPWVLVPEELLTHITTWPGGPPADHIHADMTFFETAGGGAVFSAGSITFCGSLPSAGFDNDVSRLLENVVRRFLDPTPFPEPGMAA